MNIYESYSYSKSLEIHPGTLKMKDITRTIRSSPQGLRSCASRGSTRRILPNCGWAHGPRDPCCSRRTCWGIQHIVLPVDWFQHIPMVARARLQIRSVEFDHQVWIQSDPNLAGLLEKRSQQLPGAAPKSLDTHPAHVHPSQLACAEQRQKKHLRCGLRKRLG